MTALIASPGGYGDILDSPSLDVVNVAYHAVHIVTKLPAAVCQQDAGIFFECDCVAFNENGSFSCKHAIALGLDQGLVEWPAEFDSTWFIDNAGKRPRGRQRGTGRAMPPAFVVSK